MSKQDSDRWNARYAAGAYGFRHHPSDLLARWVDEVKTSIPHADHAPVAWDIACGAGRNALYLAQQGFSVVGVDIATAGLAQAAVRFDKARAQVPELDLQARFVEQDLEAIAKVDLGLNPKLIVMFRYLNLPLLPQLLRQLPPRGWLMVEVHLQADAVAEPVGGPGSNRFRAAPGALAAALEDHQASSPYRVLHSYEGLVRDPDGSAMALAQLIVQRT